ncbi:MAG TPA: HNH endonuclease signature motif containing protein [Armatimonadota bacterium]|nr:HNH endonuclease signature motif containing protein [Armatimonadota bacterium]
MTITLAMRQQVRARAGFACEFCGISETDAGGELTIDHFHPRTRSGADSLDNLLYCCHRCNEYKADYWPDGVEGPQLWNPRVEAADAHLVEIADGTLLGITPSGAFTIRQLRLNRVALVEHRLLRRRVADERRLLTEFRNVLELLGQTQRQHAALLDEHRILLRELNRVLDILLRFNTDTDRD